MFPSQRPQTGRPPKPALLCYVKRFFPWKILLPTGMMLDDHFVWQFRKQPNTKKHIQRIKIPFRCMFPVPEFSAVFPLYTKKRTLSDGFSQREFPLQRATSSSSSVCRSKLLKLGTSGNVYVTLRGGCMCGVAVRRKMKGKYLLTSPTADLESGGSLPSTWTATVEVYLPEGRGFFLCDFFSACKQSSIFYRCGRF